MSKVAYLNGLIDGLDIDTTTKEGRVISEIAGILKSMAEEIEILKDNQKEIEDYVEVIDEDLSQVEKDLYDDEDDYDEENCDYDEDDYGNYINIKCPHCNETVYIDSDTCNCNDEITCPNCHKEISLDCCVKENK